MLSNDRAVSVEVEVDSVVDEDAVEAKVEDEVEVEVVTEYKVDKDSLVVPWVGRFRLELRWCKMRLTLFL